MNFISKNECLKLIIKQNKIFLLSNLLSILENEPKNSKFNINIKEESEN